MQETSHSFDFSSFNMCGPTTDKTLSASELNKIAKEKTTLLQEFFNMEPIHVEVLDRKTKKPKPRSQGEDMIYLWDKIYDSAIQSIVVDTMIGPSTPGMDYVDDIHSNPAMPYQQLRALVGDGGKWKWPEIWKNLVRYMPGGVMSVP